MIDFRLGRCVGFLGQSVRLGKLDSFLLGSILYRLGKKASRLGMSRVPESERIGS